MASPASSIFLSASAIASDAYKVGREPGSRFWYAPFLLRILPYTLEREAVFTIREDQLRAALEKSGTSLTATDAAIIYQFIPSTNEMRASVAPERDGRHGA
jgi:hypothetical protein